MARYDGTAQETSDACTGMPFRGGPWIMRQTWHSLLFAHWPVPVRALRPLLPPELAVDTYGGHAWVGIVAFRLTGIGLRGIPALLPFSAFLEINVRTYVTAGRTSGVYFLSLDANNPAAIAVARPWFHLAYVQAKIDLREDGSTVYFASARKEGVHPAAEFDATYQPAGERFVSTPGTLEHWLTERYSFFAVNRKHKLFRCDVYHEPWQLQEAHADIRANSMALSHNIHLPQTAPLVHYAHRMDARVWPARRLVAEARLASADGTPGGYQAEAPRSQVSRLAIEQKS